MCYTLKTVYLVVCEEKSEHTYLQELNNYLEYNDYSFTFVPKPIRSGHCTQTLRRYNQEKRKSPKNNIIICDQQGHFQRPLYSEQVEKLIKQHIFPNYQKGQIPFEITENHITNLVKNQNNPASKFKSDFVEKFFIKTHQ